MEQAPGRKVLIIYSSRSAGKTGVRGMATKEFYGNRKQGDQFEVYEADMRMRPDLFRPVAPPKPPQIVAKRGELIGQNPSVITDKNRLAIAAKKEVDAASLQAPPAPPPPEPIVEETVKDNVPDQLSARLNTLDWKGTKVNKNHLKLLMSNGITTLNDVGDLGIDGDADLLAIKGIGEGVVNELYTMLEKYSS